MKTYEMLDGTKLDLADLRPHEARFLRDLDKMGREGVSYFEVYRAAVGPGSPALRGRSRIDRRIAASPLYLAARDIATRAGIDQRLILAPDEKSARREAAADPSMLSVAQAARLIGISRAAVYKAIGRGTLAAQRIGNVTVVSRESAVAYRAGAKAVRTKRPAAKKKKAVRGATG